MKLFVGGFVGFILLLLLIMPSEIANSQTLDVNIWNGPISVNEIGDITVQEIKHRPDCEFKSIKVVKMNPPVSTIFGGVPVLKDLIYQDQGIKCVLDNAQGTFAEQNYSGSGKTSHMYSLLTSNGSLIFDPAPSGGNVLMISGVVGANYNLTLMKNFRDDSWLSTGGINYIEWRVEPSEERLKALTGSNFSLSKHAFSSNGRYLAVKYGNVVAKIDLQTLELTPVEWRSSWPTATEIAISNNGRHIAILGNGLYTYDSSTCETTFTYGNWENTNRNSYPGCVKSRNLQPELQTGVNAVAPGHDLLKRPDFTPNSASLQIGMGKRVINSNDLLPERFAWKEFRIDATNYQPNVNGYIALGDSFSSGEGDLQGGTWYEPGTDEQGNKDTFEGRNLCHLSRRSYPYLIAKELGYLAGSVSEPISPPADGLFHSVACSGAKIHNIIGGSDLGLIDYPANEDEFNKADNQYRNDYFGGLNAWQPGRIKQLDFFSGETVIVNRSPQSPKVITLGIGGNDAGFGDIIEACIMPGTCKQAVSGSMEAGELAAKIADIKPKLVNVYNSVKKENPEARIFAHGYPKFAQTGGDCAVNVRLDAQEVIMANEGVVYMNAVVQAAALEAGVFYVDVTDSLINRNLCSLAPPDQKAFNGVTAGNDISNLYLNIGTRGLCAIRTGCFGKETFHPNQLGHELYKQTIMTQTNNLQSSMPKPVKQPYPLPSDFFGSQAQSAIISANISEGLISDTILIPAQKPLVSQGSTNGLNLNQGNLLPGSTAELIVYSNPVLIGIYEVPESGILTTDFSLPESLPVGVHEIHLKGTNKYGEQIDYYEPIIIGYSNTDFDGDGILNSVDSCPSIVNSNTDVDQDGIDDVCDPQAIPVIVDPPPPPPVEPPKPTLIQRLLNLLIKIVKVLLSFYR